MSGSTTVHAEVITYYIPKTNFDEILEETCSRVPILAGVLELWQRTKLEVRDTISTVCTCLRRVPHPM
eukprot:6365242-Amphidinium_carterae.1